jgi:hypothetical protein
MRRPSVQYVWKKGWTVSYPADINFIGNALRTGLSLSQAARHVGQISDAVFVSRFFYESEKNMFIFKKFESLTLIDLLVIV